jgi:hypothetical protein
MSVLACDRNKYGYLCSSCFEELVKTKPRSEGEIKAFMSSPKTDEDPDNFDYEAYCQNEFPL